MKITWIERTLEDKAGVFFRSSFLLHFLFLLIFSLFFLSSFFFFPFFMHSWAKWTFGLTTFGSLFALSPFTSFTICFSPDRETRILLGRIPLILFHQRLALGGDIGWWQWQRRVPTIWWWIDYNRADMYIGSRFRLLEHEPFVQARMWCFEL